ncbi:acyl-CoA dehydrogenase [Vulcanimicrobium alpinum]|uniref:Acyl-CoA dehydrogenase n=1 Tax=Vulcanimicrobium alpinum TaxID=3016050 RepID=A0AAN2CAW2_UNVUL|nr:acyl-CoA dehydrogenase family protein [Vulcanimicrobium alpinum]BDE08085.1 acyl-CoA dehydrogenase [Vulcanimicrobium alpinum]
MTTTAAASLLERLEAFMAAEVYPNEDVYHSQVRSGATPFAQPPIMDELQTKARAQGLWNLFLPEAEYGAGLSNRDYAPLCEVMGRSFIAPEVFNCSAPDTGNMEVFARYASRELQDRWLRPLLNAEIRSGFAMTEPDVASSDATNISAEIRRDGDAYVVNGRKWWTTGAAHPRCKVLIFLGRSDPDAPRHQQHSMLVIPMDTPGVRIVRNLSVFGYDEAPHGHCEIAFENARVPAENLLLGEGRGFEIGQGRLGPGRLHHCLRSIGMAERALEMMVARVKERVAFGKPLAEQGVIMEWIADSRIEINQARLLTYDAAERLDRDGNKAARHELAMAKVVAPNVAQRVIDRAIQAFGGAGVSADTFLAEAYALIRTLRLADGPDEVHRASIAKGELKKGTR